MTDKHPKRPRLSDALLLMKEAYATYQSLPAEERKLALPLQV